MIDTEKLRNMGLDKAAFLALLVIGLVLAEIVISIRSSFKLSEPIAIDGRAVSVRLPVGGGFAPLSEGFRYSAKDREFRAAAVLAAGKQVKVSVQWRYFISPPNMSFAEKAQSDADSVEGHIKIIDTMQIGEVKFDYAKIVSPDSQVVVYVADTEPTAGGVLTLEIVRKSGAEGLAEKLFSRLAESVTIDSDSPLSRGKALLGRLKNYNFAPTGQKQRQNFYYIRDYTGADMGFVAESFSSSAAGAEGGYPIISSSVFFINLRRHPYSQESLFGSSANVDTFKWAVSQNDLLINRSQPLSISADPCGTVTVSGRTGKDEFVLTDTMVPEALIDPVIESFARGGGEPVMLDIIASDGSLSVVLMKNVQPDENAPADTAWAVELSFYSNSATAQKMYFDPDGRLLLNEIHGKASYRVVRAKREQIVADFPQWAEKIRLIDSYVYDDERLEGIPDGRN